MTEPGSEVDGGTPDLEVSGIHTYYGASYVLHGASLTVPRGGAAVLLGRNGMGKTTLIRSVAGLASVRQGDILLRGRSILGMPPFKISRLGIGLVPQGRRVFGSLRTIENLELPGSRLTRGRDGGSRKQTWDIARIFEVFPALADRRAARASTLSGGESQMLAIARALMSNPEVLLMDEPSEGLAPKLVEQIEQIVLRLKSEGLSILLVEQNLEMGLRVADVVYVMADGQIVFSGDPDEFAARADVRHRYLGV